MSENADAVDEIREDLANLYPELDTTAFGVTGRILRLAHEIQTRRKEHLAAFDLTPGDFDVLATIRRTDAAPGLNPRRVQQSVLITSGGLTKRLDRLEKAGLIKRLPDPDDRRGTLLQLTAQGVEVIDQVIPSLLEIESQALSEELSPRQLEHASSLLRRLGDRRSRT